MYTGSNPGYPLWVKTYGKTGVYTMQGLQFAACREIEQEIRGWMRSGATMLPATVLKDDHMTEVWLAYIEKHENDVEFVR